MNQEKKAVLLLRNNIKKLFEMKDFRIEHGVTVLSGILHGRVPLDCGNGFLLQVKDGNKDGNKIVEVLVETTSAIERNSFCKKGLLCDIHDLANFEKIEVMGKIITNQLVADRPYIFMLAESVNGYGPESVDHNFNGNCEVVDITIDNIRRIALANKREEEPMDQLISELFAKINENENNKKGLIAFTVDNKGKLAMHGKGDLYAKNIQQIARRLLELTKNNNPDYVWHFE